MKQLKKSIDFMGYKHKVAESLVKTRGSGVKQKMQYVDI